MKRRLVTATLMLGLASGIAASRILAAEINGDVGDLLSGMREKAGSMPAPNSKPLAALPSQPATKACFCETGRSPADQQGFFRLGCRMWLSSQTDCSSKQIVPQDTDYGKEEIPEGTAVVSLGYVGHWGRSEPLVRYLQKSVVPLLSKGYSVTVDNTACSAMAAPELVLAAVKATPMLEGQTLDVRGNQAISIGMWDALLPSKPKRARQAFASMKKAV